MSIEFKDYYQVLGVSPSATGEDIKKAFRALARQYHPDVAKDKLSAEEKFKELNEAHEVLSDPVSRQKYDRLGARWKAGARPRSPEDRTGSGFAGNRARGQDYEFHFEGTGFSDFYEQFFGARTARSRERERFDANNSTADPRDPKTAWRGQDLQGDLLITLDEALRGAMRSISVRRTNAHTGQEETHDCPVRIPAGVRAGQSVRVRGQGGEGSGGGDAGDIFLRVHLAAHPDWRVRGADLWGHLELAPWEAVLGATIPVKTLEGMVSMKVPAGTRQGRQLRMKGRGLPAGSGRRGDLYFEISIQVPPHIGKEEEDLWKQLAALSPFDPRKPL